MAFDIKALIRRDIDEIWNKGNYGVASELYDSSFISHFPTGDVNLEGHQKMVQLYRTAFPDLKVTVEDVVVEGEKATIHWKASGTHRGELMGVPATGRSVSLKGVDLATFRNGKFGETFIYFDLYSLLQQIGKVPALPLQAGLGVGAKPEEEARPTTRV